MSLIQQALEKTNRAQETRTTHPPTDSKTYARDPMGAVLEQKLTQVQRSYARRRKLYWRISLGVLLVCLLGGLVFMGIRGKNNSPVVAKVSVASQAPVKIYSGYIYRLTGISNSGGKAVALINNRVVSVGDELNKRAVVKAIGSGEVLLDVQGRELKLVL